MGFRSLLAASPILLNNICRREPFRDAPSLYISPSPFGASQPAIPVARTITIARIASPFSINKRYQFVFAKAIKTYFEAGRKLMKQSDTFAVPIDTDESRRVFEPKDEQSYMEEDLLGLRFIPDSFYTSLLLTF
jgi:peroxin-6